MARLALSDELDIQTNEHINPCLIKQSIMLTFTQQELAHVSAVTMAGGSSGKAKLWQKQIRGQQFHQLLLCNSFFLWRDKKEKEERERK